MRVPLKINKTVEPDDRDVVVEVAGVEFGVDGDGEHVKLYVGIKFTVVVDVPLSQTDLWHSKVIRTKTMEDQDEGE